MVNQLFNHHIKMILSCLGSCIMGNDASKPDVRLLPNLGELVEVVVVHADHLHQFGPQKTCTM